jgi:hypothetical protein
LRAKEGNPFKLSFFGAGVVVSAKHIFSAPKGESSSTVELQIAGVAAPELVWWSRSPPKHALSRFDFLAHLFVMHLNIILSRYMVNGRTEKSKRL